jgi:hypothetical protein
LPWTPKSESLPNMQTPGKSSRRGLRTRGIRGFGGWNPGGKVSFLSDFTPHAHPGRISGPPKKGGGEGSGPDREGEGVRACRCKIWMTKVYPTPPRPVETPDGTDGPPWEPGRLVFPSLDGPMVRRPGPFGSSRVYPPRWEGAVRTVETTFSHFQPLSDTCGSTFSPRGPPRAVHIRLWHSTPDGVNHAELCDGHVEIHGPKRIKYGGSLGGGPDVSWGGLSNLPSGHSRRGIPSPAG